MTRNANDREIDVVGVIQAFVQAFRLHVQPTVHKYVLYVIKARAMNFDGNYSIRRTYVRTRTSGLVLQVPHHE